MRKEVGCESFSHLLGGKLTESFFRGACNLSNWVSSKRWNLRMALALVAPPQLRNSQPAGSWAKDRNTRKDAYAIHSAMSFFTLSSLLERPGVWAAKGSRASSPTQLPPQVFWNVTRSLLATLPQSLLH